MRGVANLGGWQWMFIVSTALNYYGPPTNNNAD
jgi:hypothetical protein